MLGLKNSKAVDFRGHKHLVKTKKQPAESIVSTAFL